MFELTYGCNFKCKHCYVPESFKEKSKQELKTKEVFFIIDQLQDLGCFYLGFTGGEPFLRKDIFEILWYAKKKGFQIIIYTNGSLISKEEARELKRLKPNKVDITIPAMSKAAFERVSGVADSRNKVFRAIDLLYKNGVKLGFKSCLLKENENEIKDIWNFTVSLGALYRLDDRLSPRLDGDIEPYSYRGVLRKVTRLLGYQVTSKDRFEVCSLNFQKPERNTQYAIRNTLFKCGVGINQAAITPFGELKICLMIDYPKYNILSNGVTKSPFGLAQGKPSHQVARTENNLREAWRKLKDLVSEIKPDKNYRCHKCNLAAFCKWCPAKAWLYNRSFTTCDPESRHRAEAFW